MSVPFSNTTLRIPLGFGNLLEGLSREVLREQPHDIIGFAVTYFEDLLKKRTESGIDPADWAAQLEDRFYNNHIFKEKRTSIPEKEPKSALVTNDAEYQKKDESAVDQEEALEVLQKICINKPMYFTSISQQTISMMLQDKEKHSKHSVVRGEDGRTSAAVKVPRKGSLEEKSQVLTGAAAEQGPLDDADSKMIAVATAEVPGKGPTPEITAAEENALEGMTPQVIAVGPEESPLEKTDSQVISTTSKQGELEVNAPVMITVAPEQESLEETASQQISASLEKESKEQTTGQMITTGSAEDEEEKMQSSEEPQMDTHVNEEQAAVIIQSTYRGYRTRKKLEEDAPIPPESQIKRTA
ncbi:calcium-binding tyrosine phosphorylation-regulated protein-like isoform X2 [Narcine bancroftii]|uniref:calcium-binding tyrosine phosphorylation-regulated protein-like isoform X2 n=1 Tax=Narcine bancroftii TaxID=1343680 RepID=UPI003831AEAB